MQKLLCHVSIALVCLLLAACGGRPGSVREDAGSMAGDGIIGLLQYSRPGDCPVPTGCGPEFLLLNENLDEWTPLEGRLDPGHDGLVIEVEGRMTSIDRDDAAFLGKYAAPHAVKVKRYRLLSKIPYHDLLVEQATEFTTHKYGCDLLWDKTFGWRLVDGRVQLLVRMTNNSAATSPPPHLELAYDGTTGHFLSEELEPWGINPCAK